MNTTLGEAPEREYGTTIIIVTTVDSLIRYKKTKVTMYRVVEPKSTVNCLYSCPYYRLGIECMVPNNMIYQLFWRLGRYPSLREYVVMALSESEISFGEVT